MKLKLSVMALMLAFSMNALAEDVKPWTASVGLTYQDSNFNLPTNKYNSEAWSTNLGLMRKIDALTYVGGNISYNDSNIDYKTFAGEASVDTPSIGAYVIRQLAWGLYANGSVAYGKSQIDTNMANVRFNSDAKFVTASIGLMQYIPLSQNIMSSVSARYSHISSDRDKFLTDIGTSVPSSSSSLNYITLGGQVTYKLNQWTPFVSLEWNRASKEFMTGTGDEDFFRYSLGTRYALSQETNVGFTLGSVFDKRNTNETNAGINLSYQF